MTIKKVIKCINLVLIGILFSCYGQTKFGNGDSNKKTPKKVKVKVSSDLGINNLNKTNSKSSQFTGLLDNKHKNLNQFSNSNYDSVLKDEKIDLSHELPILSNQPIKETESNNILHKNYVSRSQNEDPNIKKRKYKHEPINEIHNKEVYEYNKKLQSYYKVIKPLAISSLFIILYSLKNKTLSDKIFSKNFFYLQLILTTAIGATKLYYLKKCRDIETDYIIDYIKKEYQVFRTKGNGITDMLPNSKCIQKINKYLSITQNSTQLISSHQTFSNHIFFVVAEQIGVYRDYVESNNLKNKLKVLNNLHDSIVGLKNDVLLSEETQLAKGIQNSHILRISCNYRDHYQQVNSWEIIQDIKKFLSENKDHSNLVFVLLHGIWDKPDQKFHYMNYIKNELLNTYPYSEFLLPLEPNFKSSSLQKQAHKLVRKTNLYKRNKASTRFVLIGHSQGAVRATLFSKILTQENFKHCLICIGGPLKGAKGLQNFEESYKKLFQNLTIRDYVKDIIDYKIKENYLYQPYQNFITRIKNIFYKIDIGLSSYFTFFLKFYKANKKNTKI